MDVQCSGKPRCGKTRVFALFPALSACYKPRVQSSPVNAATLSPGFRAFLLLVALVNGAAIMIIEILGAKMLAPYLGTSHFVWTAQIGVAMASLAAGYYLGGRWADSVGKLHALFGGMFGAAIYLCLAVLGIKAVALKCLGFSLAVGSLLASGFLFFVPLTLLAMTGPFLVRFITARLEGVGGNVGRVTSISTVGSFVGTAMVGYVLIPLAPNSLTMLGTAGAVALLALAYFLVWGRHRGVGVAAAVVTLLAAWTAAQAARRPAFAKLSEVYQRNSDFGLLQVVDVPGVNRRFFLNDYLVQNTYNPRTRQSLALFTYALHGLATAYTPRLESALCIGVGVGIVPGLLAAEGVRVTAVEINPDVIPLAERFFDFDLSKVDLRLADGRQFLHTHAERHTVVMLDAFLGDSSPAHLMTREAFADMRRVLADDGVLVINCFGDLAPGRDFFVASLDKTLKAVFADVRLHSAGTGNLFFVASPSPLRVQRKIDITRVAPELLVEVERLLPGVHRPDPRSGIVLTDDFNPVEFHDAANREELRRRLARQMSAL